MWFVFILFPFLLLYAKSCKIQYLTYNTTHALIVSFCILNKSLDTGALELFQTLKNFSSKLVAMIQYCFYKIHGRYNLLLLLKTANIHCIIIPVSWFNICHCYCITITGIYNKQGISSFYFRQMCVPAEHK